MTDTLIREGRTELPFENGDTDTATYWKDYMEGQHNRATAGQGQNLAQSVDLSGRRKLLDLGGGAASYSLALCEANPQLHSYVVDAKEPLAIAKPLVEAQHLQDRIALVEGNMNTIELDQDHDVMLISGVVLIKSEHLGSGIAAIGRKIRDGLQGLCHMSTERPTVGQWRSWYARSRYLMSSTTARLDKAGTFLCV